MSQYDQHQVKKKQSAVIHRTLLVTCRCNSVTTSAANITQYYNAKTYIQSRTDMHLPDKELEMCVR